MQQGDNDILGNSTSLYPAYSSTDKDVQRQEEIARYGLDPYGDYGQGGFLGSLGKVMEPIMDAVIKYGPVVYAAAVGADAAGMFAPMEAGSAGAAGGGFGSAGADVGLGNLAIDHAGLESLSGLGDMTAGGIGAGAATAGAGAGLGSMVGVEGGAPAVVNVGAPAAGGGLGAAPALGAGLGTAAILGNNPTMPINSGALQSMPGQDGVPYPESSLPPLVVPPLAGNSALDAVNPVADGKVGLPYVDNIGTGGGGGIPNLPSGVGSLLNGLGGLLGGNVDRIKADQDADWWKSQIDTLQGMYQPGTPEAELMRKQMEAKDAAAGRNSQYGIRETDLAAKLAGQRANIMTSAGYQNMANAYRNRSSQDLNGLFSAMGQNGGLGGLINTGINGYNTIASLFGGGNSSVPNVSLTPPVR